MAQTQWPTAQDLQRFLTAAGLVSQAPTSLELLLDLDSAVNSAVDRFQRKTGLQPFIAAVNTTRIFDPPGPNQMVSFFGMRGGARQMELSPGLLTVTTPPTVTVNTVAMVQNVQYYLYPSDAPARNQPYTKLEFLIPVYGQPQTVSITGDWGYSYTVPDGVWRAMLAGAAVALAPEIGGLITNGTIAWELNDRKMSYGAKPLQWLFDGWREKYDSQVVAYTQAGFV